MKIIFHFFFLLLALGITRASAQTMPAGPAQAVLVRAAVPATRPELVEELGAAAQTPAQGTPAPAEPPVKAVPQTERKTKPQRVEEAATAEPAEAPSARGARAEQSARSARGSHGAGAGRGARGVGGAGRANGVGRGRGH
ncbi:hypothetical protein AUC43_11190 [Hymenobacter sedentarius]|uniref:Translation initiation factor IF-2 n=1 Tax=Hymenobacter sedentarius TaxID=1411621 RepID=A0A0U3SHL9_9BACT|nr:hypothetical protein [Hymenobacter sedentarius]ALW85606.1 hypothetical protein AUC43_11190 [Hymenobacter sedentarius]